MFYKEKIYIPICIPVFYPYIFLYIPIFYREKKYVSLYFIPLSIYIYLSLCFSRCPAMDSHPEIFTFPWNRTICVARTGFFWSPGYNSNRSEAPHNSLVCSVHVKSAKYSIYTHSLQECSWKRKYPGF